MQDESVKWQPVMLVLNRRLECECGALAIFVVGRLRPDGKYNDLEDVDVWCQACYSKAQKELES